MKKINNIIAIAIIAIFAVACTNEEDFNSNSSGTTINKKNTIQGNENRPYPEYEMKDYSDGETHEFLAEFNEKVNDQSSTISDMPIEKALYIMETYVNYGVIDKANSVATEPNKENRTFTFTVPIDNGNVIGSELKNIFQEFAVNLLTTMRGKILPLSDMYVKEISATSVTFGLDIRLVPPHPDFENFRYFFPEFYGAGDNISIPANIDSPWGQWFVNQQTYWEPWPNPETGNKVIEYNVYRYSQKPINLRHNFQTNTYYTYYTSLKYDYYTDRAGGAYIKTYDYLNSSPVTPPTTVYYDNVGIATILIPSVLNRFPTLYSVTNSYMNLENRVVCDFIPKLYNGLYSDPNDGSNQWAAFFLYVSDATFGFKHVEQPQMHYMTALSIADIHPEL